MKINQGVPLQVKMINSFLQFCPDRYSRLDFSEIPKLMESAIKKSGTNDFGNPLFFEGLESFVQSVIDENEHSSLGHNIIKGFILGYLINRLHIQETLRLHPEIQNIRIKRPVFIVGMSRTGTTMLQNLLVLASDARSPCTWELFYPAPPCMPQSKQAISRIKHTRRLLSALHLLIPDLRTIHHVKATDHEECYPLINHTFTSPALAIHYGAKGYKKWLQNLDTDHRQWVYNEYMTQLKILQSSFSDKRWVLKSVIHLYFLDALLQALPEALIIQTHRDPLQMVPSICSMIRCFRKLVHKTARPEKIGMECLEFMGETIKRGYEVRRQHPNAHIIDISFDELIADPIGQVKMIHERYDLGWESQHIIKMKEWVKHNSPNRYGKHHYNLSQFGLDKEIIYNHFPAESFIPK